MAIFNGREALVKSLSEAKRPEDRKGLEGEIRIGDILAKYLPSNTYIIAQPNIGEMQPDFLIISPEFGFRIIEIKNFNIRYINKVHSNGLLVTEYDHRNPLNQVKQHVQALSNYLVSNKAIKRMLE